MKRSWIHSAIAFVTLLLATSSSAGAGEIDVVATTTDIASIYEVVGGDRVEVHSICYGFQDPHYLEAKPSYVVRLRKAEVLGYIGLELEVGWLPLLIDGARNRSLVVGGSGNVPFFGGIEIRDVPQGGVSRAQGDVHPLGNPHYWLDPNNVLEMAHTAEASLIRADPDGDADYHRGLETLQASVAEGILRWEVRMEPHRGREVVCYHSQWEYLADWLGLPIVGYIEDKPGIPPTPRHTQQLIGVMKHRAVPVIIASNYVDLKPAKKVAEETGAQLVVLPASVGGEDGVDSLEDLFELLTRRLDEAFAEAGSP